MIGTSIYTLVTFCQKIISNCAGGPLESRFLSVPPYSAMAQVRTMARVLPLGHAEGPKKQYNAGNFQKYH